MQSNGLIIDGSDNDLDETRSPMGESLLVIVVPTNYCRSRNGETLSCEDEILFHHVSTSFSVGFPFKDSRSSSNSSRFAANRFANTWDFLYP
jgi:hypothetical protein